MLSDSCASNRGAEMILAPVSRAIARTWSTRASLGQDDLGPARRISMPILAARS